MLIPPTSNRAMLYGGLRETNEREVVLIDTPAEAFKVPSYSHMIAVIVVPRNFKALLKYIYTGRLQLKTLDFHLVLDLLGLVHKYGFAELESAIPEYLKVAQLNLRTFPHFTSPFSQL
jgi:BTB/POZ domain-containing protein 9